MRLVIFCCLLLLPHFCIAKVSVRINQQQFDFVTQPRLNEVLEKVAYDASWYWPAAQLFRLNSNNATQLRIDLLAKLKLMQASLSTDNVLQIDQLIEQLNSWKLADRILINLDYDLVQTNPKFNPRLEDGFYQLELFERPLTFSVFGLLHKATTIQLNNYQCAHGYINNTFSMLKNRDYIYIIQPDGQVIKAGIAYWNSRCVDIMPGSQVFLPFEESQFFSKNTELNKQIIELALNRLQQ